jgi:hypothetical protein
MTTHAGAAEGGTRELSLFLIHRDQFDSGAVDKSGQITQSFRAVSRVDDNRGIHKLATDMRGQIGGLDGLDEAGAQVRAAGSPTGQSDRSKSACQIALIASQDLFSASSVEHGQTRVVSGNLLQFISETALGSLQLNSNEPIPESLRNRFNRSLACCSGQLSRQFLASGLRIVRGHC